MSALGSCWRCDTYFFLVTFRLGEVFGLGVGFFLTLLTDFGFFFFANFGLVFCTGSCLTCRSSKGEHLTESDDLGLWVKVSTPDWLSMQTQSGSASAEPEKEKIKITGMIYLIIPLNLP